MKGNKPKILLADPSEQLLQSIIKAPLASEFQFATATHGGEVFELLDQFQPALLYLDLMMPEIHGIELLKKIRSNPKYAQLAVIIAASNPMIQNYNASLREGANFFLEKPFEIDFLYELFRRFFTEGLKPEPFASKEMHPMPTSYYQPPINNPDTYIKLWGTRGSNPVSGPNYVRFGGNTACMEIRYGNDLIIIDAGTGIREFGQTLQPHQYQTIHIFLSHTHFDHITGFPFFNPLYDSNCQIVIWSPVGYEKSTQELLTDILAYAFFPVRLDDIHARLVFKDLRDHNAITIGDVTIYTHHAYHPGATICFKIQVPGKTIGYATDNEMFLGFHGNPNSVNKDHPLLVSHESIIEFFKHCDLLIHEAQYTPAEYQRRVGWGHSSISNATLLAKYCETKEWIVTHHDPKHTDDELYKKFQLHKNILEDCHMDCQLHFAYDGMLIPL